MWFLCVPLFYGDLYIKDNPHLFRQPMKLLNFNLYNLNSSYSPLLYKSYTTYTNIQYAKQPSWKGSLGLSYLSLFNPSVLSHLLFQKEAQYYYGFFWILVTVMNCFPSFQVTPCISLHFHLPFKFLMGKRGERQVQWSATAHNPIQHTTCREETTLAGRGGEQGRKGEAHSSSA